MENKKGLVITIVILILIALGAVGYIVYDKFIAKSDEEKEYITVINDASIDVNKLYKVGDILNTFDTAFGTNDSKYLGYIYNVEKLEVKDFDKNVAIYASIYPSLVRSNTEQTISNEMVKNKYESIFGRTLEYKPSNLDLGDNIKVEYDETNKVYKYKASITNNEHQSEYLVKNIKTKLQDDLVIITRKVFYVEYSGISAIIFKDSSRSTRIGTVKLQNGEVSLEEVTGKFGSKLNTYEYTFKLGSDDEYNFYKIERTK